MDKKGVPVVNRVIALNDIPVRDRDAPEIFGDACINIHAFNGNVVVTLATCRLSVADAGAGIAERVVSGRVIMPLGVAMELHNQLGQVMQNMRQQHEQLGVLNQLRNVEMTRQ